MARRFRPLELRHGIDSSPYELANPLSQDRFRIEASEERREKMRYETRKDSSSPSPVERAFDIASSSVISASFLIIGLVAAQVVCLPILLLLRVSAMLFFQFNSRRDDVDSSIRPYSPPTDDVDACTFTERILFYFVGSPPHSCSSSGQHTVDSTRSNVLRHC